MARSFRRLFPSRRATLLAASVLLAACSRGGQRASVSSADSSPPRSVVDTAPRAVAGSTGADTAVGAVSIDAIVADSAIGHMEDTARVRAVPLLPEPGLSARADTLADRMTFLATFQRTFVAAARAKRMLLDLGRVDLPVKTPARLRAFEQAAKRLSPVRVGDRFRLYGPWGQSDATVTGYEPWNGRIAATLDVPREVQALARRREPLVALAVREDSTYAADSAAHADSVAAADSAARAAALQHGDTAAADSLARADSLGTTASPDRCVRDSVDAMLLTRDTVVEDSLRLLLQADTAGLPPRVRASRRIHITRARGCFGSGRILIFANTAGGLNEITREYTVLIDTAGAALPVRVYDERFKVHEALRVLDADGDGVDDIAAIGRGERTGGTVILRFDPVRRRLVYLMSGFAWENF